MKKQGFLDGPILPVLLKFAGPVLLALFLQALYGAVDLWAVGTFGTPADMSAVSTGSQAMLVITGFITGLCMGITVILGQRIGEKNEKQAAEVLGASLWILTILGAAVTVLLLIFAPSVAKWVQAPPEAFDQTVSYIRLCGGGTLFIAGYNGISGLFRGVGDSKSPLLFAAIACAVNIAGDILLIRQFHLGAAGAAIATIAAQAVSVVLSLVFICRKGLPFAVTRRAFAFHRGTVGHILRLGLPIALTDMGNEICYLILIGFTNTLGVVVSAGVGAAEKLIIFLLLIPMAYMSSISTFTAQNIGAGQPERTRKGMWLGMLTAGILGAGMSALLFFRGEMLTGLFNSDPAVMAASGCFLRATSLECLVLSAAYCLTGYLNGVGKTGFVMVQGLCANFLVKIPAAYLALRYLEEPLFPIGFATVLGALFTLAASLIYAKRLQKREVCR